MKMIRGLGLSLITAVVLAACGGGDDKPVFTRVVSFGDSLSDVGSYATPGLVASTGGGKYTVNAASAKIWVEQLAARVGASAPCAAQLGLESSGPLASLASVPASKPGCFAYGQGGARVTNPVGPYNKAILALGDTGGYLGQLTVPLVTQIQRHLATGGFMRGDLVLVLAGGNDLFMNLAAVGAGGPAAAAVTAMGAAGSELAGYVRNLQAQGALHLVVVNLGDVSKTPFAYGLPAATQGLVQSMSKAYNDGLAAGLSGTTGILMVDAYTSSQDQASNPTKYGFSNATRPACDLAKATLGSLGCSVATLISGDVSKYQFADTVHPTPYAHQVFMEYVSEQMVKVGWL